MIGSSPTALARPRSTLLGDSASSATWTLVSRVTGLARVVLIGAVLGPTYFGNLFQLANQLPWIVFELAVGSLLPALLIPALMSAIAEGDRAKTERIAGGFLGLVIVGFTVITVLVIAASSVIAGLFAIPVTDAAVRSHFVRAAVPLLIVTAPQLIGYGIAMTGQAVQQAMGRFALPAAAGIAENIIVIATLAGFAIRFGTGLPLAEIGTGHIVFLGAGATLGVAVHAGVQLWGVRTLGLRLRPRMGWSDPEIAGIVRNLAPSSVTAALNSLRLFVLMVAANTVPGGVVAFQLALNALHLPVALGAKPVAYASLPRLSLHGRRSDWFGFRSAYQQSLNLAALILVPAALASVAFGRFAAGGVALGEMAGDDGRRLIGLGLVGVGGAVLGEGLYQLATSAAYAMDYPVGPLLGMGVRLAVTVAGIGASAVLVDEANLLLGVALSMSVGDLLGSLTTHRKISGRLPSGGEGLRRAIGVALAAALPPFLVVGAIVQTMSQTGSTRLGQAAVLAITVALVTVAFGCFAVLIWRFDGRFAGLVSDYRRANQDAVKPAGAR